MKKIRTAGLLLIITTVLVAGYLWYKSSAPMAQQQGNSLITRTFTTEELAHFDGTDPEKPIYLALNGLVYDVSTGRNYYETGGSYHWLAGKDSSKDLNLIGGDIIKRKYPVIGKLVQ